MEWIWDVDKKQKIKAIDFLPEFWHILEIEAGEPSYGDREAIAVLKQPPQVMRIFRGTEQECQDYIDEQTE